MGFGKDCIRPLRVPVKVLSCVFWVLHLHEVQVQREHDPSMYESLAGPAPAGLKQRRALQLARCLESTAPIRCDDGADDDDNNRTGSSCQRKHG